jgi:peptide deformylase
MNKLVILTDPNPKLRQKSIVVESVDREINQHITDMLTLLRLLPGYGLAAPQVGLQKRIVIIENPPITDDDGKVTNKPLPLHILINPEIVKYSTDKCSFEEGCFSVPLYRGDVIRPVKIRVKAINEKGEKVQINASGLLARVLQHEIDHLDGILFTDLIEDKSKLIKNEIGPEWKEAIEG